MRNSLIAALTLTLIASASGSAPTRLGQTSELADGPDGQRVGLLMPGTPVTVLETRDDWMRVRIEGWVPSAHLAATESGGAVPVMPATPEAPGTTATGEPGRLVGSVYVTVDGETIVGSGTAVRLLAADPSVLPAMERLGADCRSERETLLAEAARLKEQAGKSLRIDDKSEAFEQHDRAKWERDEVLAAIESHDAECDGRAEKLASGHERHRTLTSAEGRYTFDAIPPGDYLLNARLDTESTRYVWLVPISVGPASEQSRDLSNGDLLSSDPLGRPR